MTWEIETNKWFDELVIESETLEHKDNLLKLVTRSIPNKKNLKDVIKILANEKAHLRGAENCLQTGLRIINNQFTTEFRYQSQNSRFGGKCSATGSYFSLIRQALNYYDHNSKGENI